LTTGHTLIRQKASSLFDFHICVGLQFDIQKGKKYLLPIKYLAQSNIYTHVAGFQLSVVASSNSLVTGWEL